MLRMSSSKKDATSVDFAVETDSTGIYEVRFHKLKSTGDSKKAWSAPLTAKQETVRFFEKFSSLNFYYNEVNKIV